MVLRRVLIGCLLLWLGVAHADEGLPCSDGAMPVAECLQGMLDRWQQNLDEQQDGPPAAQAQLARSLQALHSDIPALATTLENADEIAATTAAREQVLALSEQLADQYRSAWQRTALTDGLFADGATNHWLTMLRYEIHLTGSTLDDQYLHWMSLLEDDAAGLSRYRDLISAVLALIVAILIFIGLHRLARRSTAALLHLHNLILEKANKRRWMKALARLVSGLAPLMPWILLWLVLDGFASLFSGSNAALLLWWVPLAQLYIIYGLLCLLGEWLLLRICSGAGVFLNSEQTKVVSLHARSRSRWIIWPWVLLYLVDHWIGPSLLYRVVELGGWIVIWFVLGSLLQRRRQEYLANLQRLLPEQFDPLAEKILAGRRFLLIAALLLPLQLWLFLREYLDQLLSDFDWYRSLSARWFRIRTRATAEDDTDEDVVTEEISEHYERWFTPEGDGKTKMPVIDTGLLTAMRKPVDAWLNDRTDENVLLVTGEKGMGKSAALTRLQEQIGKEFPDIVLQRLTVPAKSSSQDAVYQLIGEALDTDMRDGPVALARSDEKRQPTILMLDEAQNLFLSEVGYLDGWRALIDLTNTRLENLFWVIAINNQSWAYLCNVFGREYQMRNVIRVKRWSQSEIRSLILSRNHLSGYKLRYDDVLLATRGPEAGNLRNAEQRYFSLLWDSCRGVPMAALELWLTSIRTDGRAVVVGLPHAPGMGVLEKLGPKLLFVYAAIATHENLTSEEISKVTNQPQNVVRYALKAGMDAEFIVRGEDGRYRIRPLWYHTVISYLNRKNMLHE